MNVNILLRHNNNTHTQNKEPFGDANKQIKLLIDLIVHRLRLRYLLKLFHSPKSRANKRAEAADIALRRYYG